MPTTIKPSEAEVLKFMAAHKIDDAWTARARLEQQLFVEAEREKAAAAAEEQIAPWRIEPTHEEILSEMRTRGLSFSDAREKLVKAMVKDARRLASVIPSAKKQISAALDESEAAKVRADNLLSEKQAVVDGLAASVHKLCSVRLKIRWTHELALDDGAERNFANQVLELNIANHESPCNLNDSTYLQSLKWLVYKKTITPFIGEYVEKLESIAAGIIAEIRSTAKREGVDLAEFLKGLVQARLANQPGVHLPADSELYAGLL